MKPLLLAVLLLCGCAERAGTDDPARPYIVRYVPEAGVGAATIRLMKIRRCDYVVLTSEYANGGTGAVVHAADCENPAHAVGTTAEKP